MKIVMLRRLFIFVSLSIGLAACDNHSPDSNAESHKMHERRDAEVEVGHEGHSHDHEGPSDLDRSVHELFTANCEHRLNTYTCDECRYEVGVVKTDKRLFEEGLLQKTKAKKKMVTIPLKLTGEVHFDDRRVAHVSTQVKGIIKAVHAIQGEKVKKGQALIEIESVEIGEAQAAYLEKSGMLTLAKRNYERIDALHQEGISSEKELLVAKQEFNMAKIRADAAFGKLKRLGMSSFVAQRLTLETAVGRMTLRAPVAGTVLEMDAVAGEVARPAISLATIGDNSPVWVWADIFERDLALISREQAQNPLRATVEVKAFPGTAFAGMVDFISPLMNESSRTVKARITVPNQAGQLLAGMFAEVKLLIPGDQQVLVVPSESILEDEGRSFVFIHHEGDYWVRRSVTQGRNFAGLIEITKGLTGSEIIVANGAFLLKSDVLRSKMGAGCAD